MRLLVISDSHGRTSLIDRVLRRETEAKDVFFLGDVVSDIEEVMPEYPDRRFYIVRGNCDYFCSYPAFNIVNIEGIDIFMTHGHNYGVKSGTELLFSVAKNTGAKLVLYGHTHISSIEYSDGIHLINGGSLSRPRDGRPSYAVIDITDSGILPAIKYI